MLKDLCALNATSGREEAVRDYLIAHLPKEVEYFVDPLGSLIVKKKGKRRPKNRVMLASHMDEVALIITYITDEGYLKFAPVGGIDSRVLFGKRVKVGPSALPGVIGGKAIHQLTKGEKDTVPEAENMLIDIGAADKKDAERLVALGDNAYFDSEYVEFGDGFVKSKALDDRVGNLIMLEMIEKDLPFDMTFCFTVQEEIGTRGATAAATRIAPDYAIVIESTTAADLPDTPNYKQVCKLGAGAVVGFMDRGTVYDRALYKQAFELARENGIACQTKTMIAGGNDASAIHKAAGGVRTLAVSVPCRYIHSPACVAKKSDIDCVAALVERLAEAFCDAPAD